MGLLDSRFPAGWWSGVVAGKPSTVGFVRFRDGARALIRPSQAKVLIDNPPRSLNKVVQANALGHSFTFVGRRE